MIRESLYQEWGHKLIPSSYGELNGKKRYYRVFYGTVHWHTADPWNIHKVCTVFVQYGTTEDFDQSRKKGEIRENYPCHILDEDMEEVMAAMKELKEQFNEK
jgi:hypothetical protein